METNHVAMDCEDVAIFPQLFRCNCENLVLVIQDVATRIAGQQASLLAKATDHVG